MENQETQMIASEDNSYVQELQATIDKEIQKVCAGVIWFNPSEERYPWDGFEQGYWLSVNSEYVDAEETIWLGATYYEAKRMLLATFKESVRRFACPF